MRSETARAATNRHRYGTRSYTPFSLPIYVYGRTCSGHDSEIEGWGRWEGAGVKDACKRTYISTFAENSTQVKTGFSSCLPYSRWCRPPAVKLGEPTSVTRESDISCSVRVSSVDEEAGTRDGDAHLMRGGFIIRRRGRLCAAGHSPPDASTLFAHHLH